MASASNFLENKLIDHSLGTTSWTMPADVYLALYTVAPSDSGGGTEVSGSAYAREVITFDSAASGSASNDGELTFTASGGNWGTIVATGIFDASSGGNLLYHGALSTSRTINDGESLVFTTGSVTVTCD